MPTSSTTRLYSLPLTAGRTYLALLFTLVGGLVLPQLFHLIPRGGLIFLPIYFFTFLSAYKWGWRVGLLAAIITPIANSILFGMPHLAVVPLISLKGVYAAAFASFAASRSQRVSLRPIALAVVGYTLTGFLSEWGLTGSLDAALSDIRVGFPGLLLQVFGCWALLRYALTR